MLRIDESTSEAVSAYVTGWAVSRGAPAPTPVALGWHVATGQPHESERYVPVRGSLAEVVEIASSLRTPLACLKFAGRYDEWRPSFGVEWIDNPVGWFMTCKLAREQDSRPPLGRLDITVDGRLITARVALGNETIATGRTGLAGDWCVPDRIRTSEEHRRKGLGGSIMRALLAAAREAGATRAVLDASVDGRRLYEATGWTMCSPQFGLTRADPAAHAPATRVTGA